MSLCVLISQRISVPLCLFPVALINLESFACAVGQTNSALSNEELEEYEYCTFFNRKEILLVHQRFSQLKMDTGEDIVALKNVLKLPEITNNPFRERCAKRTCINNRIRVTFR